jgi:predicted lipoprotein
MKNLNVLLLSGVMFAALSFTSCGDDDDNSSGGNDGYGYDFTATITTYIDEVVVPTYTSMKDDVKRLYDAVIVYDADPSNLTKLNAVCTAWRAARIPWEQSEGFLFGPAALLSLDPSLDSWPLDKGEIETILNRTDDITPKLINHDNWHGFHAIEFLIFDNGNPKTAVLNERERTYLLAATRILKIDTYLLWANWIGKDAINDDDVLSVFEEEEIDVAYNFSAQFKKAGLGGSLFASQDEAIDQIIEGCSTIADEVGAQKIGGPNGLAKDGKTEQAVLEVESWYSWNSIDDYANNIVSIRNSYFGGRGRTAATAGENSLSAFVKSKNPSLDIEIAQAIETAYNSIANRMERPFRNNLTGAKVDEAMDACADLVRVLDKIKALKN